MPATLQTGEHTMKPKVKKVSLSGKTRLTYREAVALLHGASLGEADMESDEERFDGNQRGYLHAAMEKLKRALDAAGGYGEDGNLYDPFQE